MDDATLISRRFIPAPAGNTRRKRHRHAASPVHPRACGEHGLAHGVESMLFGSSPRLRGTHVAHRVMVGKPRFIPAPAGNTPHPTG